MSILDETVGDLRAGVMRGLVLAVDDTGQMQRVDVQTHDGAVRAGIEVYQPFGSSAAPIAVGSVALLLAVGADVGDLVALPLLTPAGRFGGLAPGECVVYGADGSRVAIRQGGTIEVLAGETVLISAPGVTIQAPNGCTVVGDLSVQGSITATGDVTDRTRSMAADRAIFDQHTHPPQVSDPPSPQQ